MLAEEFVPGMRVRYPRTGTTGTILHIESIGRVVFAELDSTHLLYRVDLLIPAPNIEKASNVIVEDAKTVIAREREFAAGTELQEAIKNIDQAVKVEVSFGQFPTVDTTLESILSKMILSTIVELKISFFENNSGKSLKRGNESK